jgi:hypothetical protein
MIVAWITACSTAHPGVSPGPAQGQGMPDTEQTLTVQRCHVADSLHLPLLPAGERAAVDGLGPKKSFTLSSAYPGASIPPGWRGVTVTVRLSGAGPTSAPTGELSVWWEGVARTTFLAGGAPSRASMILDDTLVIPLGEADVVLVEAGRNTWAGVQLPPLALLALARAHSAVVRLAWPPQGTAIDSAVGGSGPRRSESVVVDSASLHAIAAVYLAAVCPQPGIGAPP